MLIGYARVSTHDQHLDLQEDALKRAGCEKVFVDRVSGTVAERLGLAKVKELLRKGDTLIVWRLDRLGRSLKDLRVCKKISCNFGFFWRIRHAGV